MRRIETDRKRGTRAQAEDRRRLYEVPERPLIVPQGESGRVQVSDRDETDMQDGYIVRRRPRILAKETFYDATPDTGERYFSGTVAENWAEKYDAANVVSQVSGYGEMNINLGGDNSWGVFYVSSKLALQKDIEVAARVKYGSGANVLLGVRLSGAVSDNGDGTYSNLQDGIWIRVGDSSEVLLVKDGVEDQLGILSSKPPYDAWFWITLAVKSSWVYASMGGTNEEYPLEGREPFASQLEVRKAGHTGIGITGDMFTSVDASDFVARTPTV